MADILVIGGFAAAIITIFIALMVQASKDGEIDG